LYRQRTNYQTNRWNMCITWRARRRSCSDVIVPERCASYNALILFCEWHHTSLAFWQAGNPFPLGGLQKQWRIPHVWDAVQLRPHSSVETRMPWLDCVVSAQLRINQVLVPQLNRERTGQPSVTETCVELFYYGVISVLLMQWCGKGVNLIRRQKKPRPCGSEYADENPRPLVHYRQTQFLNPTPQRFTVMKKQPMCLERVKCCFTTSMKLSSKSPTMLSGFNTSPSLDIALRMTVNMLKYIVRVLFASSTYTSGTTWPSNSPCIE